MNDILIRRHHYFAMEKSDSIHPHPPNACCIKIPLSASENAKFPANWSIRPLCISDIMKWTLKCLKKPSFPKSKNIANYFCADHFLNHKIWALKCQFVFFTVFFSHGSLYKNAYLWFHARQKVFPHLLNLFSINMSTYYRLTHANSCLKQLYQNWNNASYKNNV